MNPADIARLYYAKVDGGDVDWIVDLFAEDATYRRADAEYEGKAEIEAFYRAGRKIRGEHVLNEIIDQDDRVMVTGEFVGTGVDGAPKRVAFADVWVFDERSRVVERRTYLAIGSDYVKE